MAALTVLEFGSIRNRKAMKKSKPRIKTMVFEESMNKENQGTTRLKKIKINRLGGILLTGSKSQFGIIDECSCRFRIFTKGMDVDMVALMAARTSGVENQEAMHVGILGMLADPKKVV
ncbi:hypothetical protein CTI12_AA559700 [Artemisia annua]|uniref:Uncharacterized protein n=1 Tax=Artemisia annua TaxID=35608 RepID=A0A2U1KV27_ARTAN|nr:hypothetical protein CTI12_AA559700 [Artemisia annua]